MLGRDTDHSNPTSVEVKNEELYLSALVPAWCSGMALIPLPSFQQKDS
jgi:hypothetical protein